MLPAGLPILAAGLVAVTAAWSSTDASDRPTRRPPSEAPDERRDRRCRGAGGLRAVLRLQARRLLVPPAALGAAVVADADPVTGQPARCTVAVQAVGAPGGHLVLDARVAGLAAAAVALLLRAPFLVVILVAAAVAAALRALGWAS